MPTEEYSASYESQRKELNRILKILIENPDYVVRFLSSKTGVSTQASPTTTSVSMTWAEWAVQSAASAVQTAASAVQTAASAVQTAGTALWNYDIVANLLVGNLVPFYKKELGKLAITAKGGYELELLSELKDQSKLEDQYVAGKIYLSDDGQQAWLLNLEGKVQQISALNIDMDELPQKRNDPAFIKEILSSIPKQDIYVYNSETPLFFIEFLKDLNTETFIIENSPKITKLFTTPEANSILSIVLSTITKAVPKEGQPASVAQVIVTELGKQGVDAKFILDTVSPLIQPIVAELTANPGRLKKFAALAENIIITSDKDEKAKFQKEFLSEVASIDFAGTKSINALRAFVDEAQSVAKLTQMTQAVAPTLALRLAIPGVDIALIESIVPIIRKTASVFLGKATELQRVAKYFTSATPRAAEANAELVTNLFGLVKTLGDPKAGFIKELPDYFVNNKDKMIVAATDVLHKRREKSPEKELPAYMNDELILSLIGSVIDALPTLLPFILDTTVSSLIQPIVAELTANPERLNEFSSLVGKIRLTEDQKEKANLQKEFLSKVASIDFAGTQAIKALSDFFVNEGSVVNLTKIVEVVAPTLAASVGTAGIDATLIAGSVPIITKTASVLLGKPAELQSVAQYFTSATLATEETNATLVKDLSSLVGALQAPQAGFAGQLSRYIIDNNVQMRVAVKGLFNKNNEVLNEAQTLNKAFNEALIDSAMNLAVEFSHTLSPFVLNLSQKILAKPGASELLTLFMLSRADEKNSKAEPQLAALPEEKRADLISNRQKLLAKSADFILQDESLKDFFADPASMPKVKEITGKILDTPALTQRLATLGIEKDLVLDAVPILAGTAGAILDNPMNLQSLVKYLYPKGLSNNNLPDLTINPPEISGDHSEKRESYSLTDPNPHDTVMTPDDLFVLASNIRNSFQNKEDIFTKKLPNYLSENDLVILKVLTKPENLAAMRKNLKIPDDFTDGFILDVAAGGLQVSEDLIPFAFKVASRALDDSNQTAVIKIMEHAKKAFTPLAPMSQETDGVALTKDARKAQAKQPNLGKQGKEKEISSLVNLVLNLKNNDPDLKKLIDQEFPTILAKHSNLLGGLLDEFLNKTTLGKYVDIRAKDYLEVASRHIPKLIDIAQLYNDKQYTRMFKTRMFLKAFPLIFEKGILVLMMRYFSYQYQAKSQSGFRRRLRAQGSIRKKLSEMLAAVVPENSVAAEVVAANAIPKNSPKRDLGAALATHPHTGDSTLDYSLINKDFRGIHFSFKPAVGFQNCILDGFKFNNAKLNTSFQGSEIRNCDFTGVVFTDAVSFQGAEIDKSSLDTLIPAIAAYNNKHPKAPIETRGIIPIPSEEPGVSHKHQP